MGEVVLDSGSILVVDGEPRLLRFLKSELQGEGYTVITAGDGDTAVRLLASNEYDLFLLDIMLPDMDGFSLLRQLRESSPLPVIILTARSSDEDKVRGLNLGADDYLAKPFNTPELLARIKAVLRRTRAPELTRPGPPFICGDLTLDFAQRRLWVHGQEVRLSPTEYRLLRELALHAGRMLLREDLLARVWGRSYRKQNEYLWVYIGYLREKIERDPKNPEYVVTKPGVGYMLRRPG